MLRALSPTFLPFHFKFMSFPATSKEDQVGLGRILHMFTLIRYRMFFAVLYLSHRFLNKCILAPESKSTSHVSSGKVNSGMNSFYLEQIMLFPKVSYDRMVA